MERYGLLDRINRPVPPQADQNKEVKNTVVVPVLNGFSGWVFSGIFRRFLVAAARGYAGFGPR